MMEWKKSCNQSHSWCRWYPCYPDKDKILQETLKIHLNYAKYVINFRIREGSLIITTKYSDWTNTSTQSVSSNFPPRNLLGYFGFLTLTFFFTTKLFWGFFFSSFQLLLVSFFLLFCLLLAFSFFFFLLLLLPANDNQHTDGKPAPPPLSLSSVSSPGFQFPPSSPIRQPSTKPPVTRSPHVQPLALAVDE